jgi:hypothetical protein
LLLLLLLLLQLGWGFLLLNFLNIVRVLRNENWV